MRYVGRAARSRSTSRSRSSSVSSRSSSSGELAIVAVEPCAPDERRTDRRQPVADVDERHGLEVLGEENLGQLLTLQRADQLDEGLHGWAIDDVPGAACPQALEQVHDRPHPPAGRPWPRR